MSKNKFTLVDGFKHWFEVPAEQAPLSMQQERDKTAASAVRNLRLIVPDVPVVALPEQAQETSMDNVVQGPWGPREPHDDPEAA